MKKRLLAILLAVCLIATLMPTSALAYVGGLHDKQVVGVEAWRDDEFLYLASDCVQFMIEHDYGLGMQLWTKDEVASWGQGVQEMRFTIQYPGQEERDMNVTRLEQSWTDGFIWLTYHFGNDHYKTTGDVEITYEAQITLAQVDSGAASGYTGQYVEFDQSDGKQNWAVLIKGEFEYDSDSVVFDLGGELDQVGATARVYTTYEGFPNMGHETYQNQKAPVPVMLSSYDVSASADLTGFLDYGQISEYALPALQWAVGAGVMSGRGDGILAPQGTATRAEAAAMLMRFAENVK